MRLTPALFWCGLAAAVSPPATVSAAPNVGVGVVRSAEWSPGDAAREGAGEFLVLLNAAKLQRNHAAAGLVAVGDRNGMLRSGGERALRRLALTGVVVVRLAPGGTVAETPDNLFLDARDLDEAAAQTLLARGLELYGAPPVVADPERPAPAELAAIHAHLKKIQLLFAVEAGPQVALR